MASKWRIFRWRDKEKWYLAHFTSITGKRFPKWIQLVNLVYQEPMLFNTKEDAEAVVFELVALQPERIGLLSVDCVRTGRRTW